MSKDKITDKESPYWTDMEIRDKIDELLRQNAKIECNLGTDSTPKQFGDAKLKQNRLFNKIKALDQKFYEIIVIPEDRD